MAQYKIEIDRDECIGCQQCVCDAPATFGMDDEGEAVEVEPERGGADVILAAVQNCPVEAITLYDAETGARIWPEERSSVLGMNLDLPAAFTTDARVPLLGSWLAAFATIEAIKLVADLAVGFAVPGRG
jgi:ferredoxin